MGNNLNKNLLGKFLVIGRPRYDAYYVFKVHGGFGAEVGTHGTAINGKTIIDGESFRLNYYDQYRLATPEEILLQKWNMEYEVEILGAYVCILCKSTEDCEHDDWQHSLLDSYWINDRNIAYKLPAIIDQAKKLDAYKLSINGGNSILFKE